MCNTGLKGHCTDTQDSEATLAASSNLSLSGAGKLSIGVHKSSKRISMTENQINALLYDSINPDYVTYNRYVLLLYCEYIYLCYMTYFVLSVVIHAPLCPNMFGKKILFTLIRPD